MHVKSTLSPFPSPDSFRHYRYVAVMHTNITDRETKYSIISGINRAMLLMENVLSNILCYCYNIKH